MSASESRLVVSISLPKGITPEIAREAIIANLKASPEEVLEDALNDALWELERRQIAIQENFEVADRALRGDLLEKKSA